jgi:hypothetical protein
MVRLLLDSRRQQRDRRSARAATPAGAYATIALKFSMPARTGIDLKPTNRDLDQQRSPFVVFARLLERG